MNRFIVVIPVYNAENEIGRCVMSVRSQEYGNYDYIVIDDASTDNTYFEASHHGEYKFGTENDGRKDK